MKRPPTPFLLVLLFSFFSLVLFSPGCGGTAGDGGELPSRLREVIDSTEFEYATWGIKVVDLASGDELFEPLNPDFMLDPASTTKLFTVATGFDVLGADYTFSTPVYRRGEVDPGGILSGDLILVAGGDLAMGGRGAMEGTIEYTSADHNDANALGMGELTEGDPLAGLDDLAAQVAGSGIAEVNGDVIIDDRLFGPSRSFDANEEYIITPMVINDNLVDLVVKPTQPGNAAEVEWRPLSAAYVVENRVETGTGDSEVALEVYTAEPGVIVAEGLVPEGEGEVVSTYQVEDPASFARTLFIEALRRAGVVVDAPETGENNAGKLPAKGEYTEAERVALLESPPFEEYARLILKVSHNLGADTLLYIIAVHEGGQTMQEGLAIERDFLVSAGVDASGLILNDGQGATGSNLVSAAPAIQLLRYMSTRDDFDVYRGCLPVLGVDGSLAGTLPDSPARGKVQAKTGTHGGGDAMNNRIVLFARALGGYMVTSGGRELAFYIDVNNVPLDDPEGFKAIIDRHAGIVEILYEEY